MPGATLFEDASGAWLDAGVDDATYNAVVSTHVSAPAANAHIASILTYFGQRSRPFTWHVGPASEPGDLAGLLVAHGLALIEEEPGMAIELDHLPAGVELPEGFTIETVRDERGLEDWVAVWLFPVPDDVRRLHLDVLLRRGLRDNLPWRYFVGRLNGKPIATSELFVGAGLAGVHYVVTLPEARQQGIGTAMTRHVLREALEAGCRVACLTASPDGVGLYRRLGFREYCRFRRFEWQPGGDSSAT